MFENKYIAFLVSLVLCYVVYRWVFNKTLQEVAIRKRIRKTGVKTEGRIIGLEESSDLDGFKTYRPIIEFYTTNNQKNNFTNKDGTMEKPSLHSTVPVLYEFGNPHNAWLDSKSQNNFDIIKLIISLLTLFLSIFFLIRNTIILFS